MAHKEQVWEKTFLSIYYKNANISEGCIKSAQNILKEKQKY